MVNFRRSRVRASLSHFSSIGKAINNVKTNRNKPLSTRDLHYRPPARRNYRHLPVQAHITIPQRSLPSNAELQNLTKAINYVHPATNCRYLIDLVSHQSQVTHRISRMHKLAKLLTTHTATTTSNNTTHTEKIYLKTSKHAELIFPPYETLILPKTTDLHPK